MEQETQTNNTISGPLTTEVTYTNGMLGRSNPGTLQYDGTANVTLIDKTTNQVVFSQPITALGRVKRVEYALYFKIAGKSIPVLFGNTKEYALKSGATMNVGLPGLIYSTVAANTMNQKSGLESWVSLLTSSGAMGANMSPNNLVKNTLKYTFFAIGGIVVVAIIVAMIK